ncbi:MAG TPA: tRNA lysidine(34) synthetase TilS, partial [Gammaproteobacteria bacterium]
LAAVHIHHGLQAPADRWLDHCVAQCAALKIPCQALRVSVARDSGEGLEASARRARYQAIAGVMEAGDMLLTAHHQDDQAETLLLQLLRGSGVSGLAAMAPIKTFAHGWHARPLLDCSRPQLHAYAEATHLAWIDDPSNFDISLERNHLRQRVMPLLHERNPAIAATLSRSARHFAEAAELLEELAGIDLPGVCGGREGTLSVRALLSLSPARRRNLLRHWIRMAGFLIPNTCHLQRICDEVLPAAPDSIPLVQWRGAEVRRYRDDLFVMAPLPPAPVVRIPWDLAEPLLLPPGVGTLTTRHIEGGGLAMERLAGHPVEVRFRTGGELCRPAGRHETHALKKLLQEQGIPPWQRERLPLLFVAEKLAQVGTLWCCEPYAAHPGEMGIVVDWFPAAIENRSQNNDN